jgi:hydroxypyruvate reductase
MTVNELRSHAQTIWEASLDAASPAVCIPRILEPTRDGFRVAGHDYRVEGRLIVIGAGKAGSGMARVVDEMFGARIASGLVITKYGHSLPTENIQVFEAGHPVPDESGVLGVEGIRELLRDLDESDVVLCLISGGGSALLPSPAEGITLKEKQDVTNALLRAGSTITELNAVRKHLSAIKGGQLLGMTAPARVVSLVMSDVIGDPLDYIASGPTAPDTSTFEDARRIVGKYGIDVSPAIIERFDRGIAGAIPETPKIGDPLFDRVANYIVANNRLLLESAANKARELGFETLVLSSEIEGEARDVGRVFASIAREIEGSRNPVKPPACVLAAGETTVTVRGDGSGGRNQEMALAWALKMTGATSPVCFASVASDGTDGPTDAAGGIVDPETCARAERAGRDPAEDLRANNAYELLDSAGDLILTGPTETNLMDIQILLAG